MSWPLAGSVIARNAARNASGDGASPPDILIRACSFACKPFAGGEYAPRHPDAAQSVLHMAYDGRTANRGAAV